MATLPDAAALGERPTPHAGGSVAGYSAPVSNIGQGISRAGRDMVDTAAVVAQMNDRQDAMNAQGAANRLSEQAMRLQQDQQTGFAGIKGGDTATPQFTKGFTAKFDTARAEVRASLTNENQRQAFDAHANATSLHFQSALLQHQAVQTNAFNKGVEDDTINFGRRMVFDNPADASAIQAGFAKIDWAIQKKADREGWSPEMLQNAKVEYRSKVFEDVVAMGVERDPVSALAMMNKRMGIGGPPEKSGNAAVDGLDVDKLISLHHRARSYVEQQANRARAEDDKRLKIAEDVYQAAEKLALTGAPFSQAFERELMAKTAGTHFETQAKAIAAASLTGATFGTKTLGQQREVLRQADEAVGKTGTDPASKVMLDKMREIHATQEAAYKENPWAAAARFAHQPSVPDEPGKDVREQIKARAPLMAGIEVASGAPASPLQPGEARAYVEKLRGLPPDAAAKEVGSVGAMLTLPRLEALANQLDKQDKPLALAMKLGTDGTTAGRPVAELLLRGAQALKDKTVKRDDTVLTGWRSEISALVRGTLGDAKAEDDAIDAAYYIRAAMDADGSKAPGYHFEASAHEAVRFAVGVPMERNGVKTVLPREMDEDGFDARLKAFTPDVLRSMAPVFYVRGQPIAPEKLAGTLDRLGMRRDGQGGFVPSSGGAFVTLDPAGQVPLRLPMR
jgi:hypothetical protein